MSMWFIFVIIACVKAQTDALSEETRIDRSTLIPTRGPELSVVDTSAPSQEQFISDQSGPALEPIALGTPSPTHELSKRPTESPIEPYPPYPTNGAYDGSPQPSQLEHPTESTTNDEIEDEALDDSSPPSLNPTESTRENEEPTHQVLDDSPEPSLNPTESMRVTGEPSYEGMADEALDDSPSPSLHPTRSTGENKEQPHEEIEDETLDDSPPSSLYPTSSISETDEPTYEALADETLDGALPPSLYPTESSIETNEPTIADEAQDYSPSPDPYPTQSTRRTDSPSREPTYNDISETSPPTRNPTSLAPSFDLTMQPSQMEGSTDQSEPTDQPSRSFTSESPTTLLIPAPMFIVLEPTNDVPTSAHIPLAPPTPTFAPMAVLPTPRAISSSFPTFLSLMDETIGGPSLPGPLQQSYQPSALSAEAQSDFPTSLSSISPTSRPWSEAIQSSSDKPSTVPTWAPVSVSSPSVLTIPPTRSPSSRPTRLPNSSDESSTGSTGVPLSVSPTSGPTVLPTRRPSPRPTRMPSDEPSTVPTRAPLSVSPTIGPTVSPTRRPSSRPTREPSDEPSTLPAKAPQGDSPSSLLVRTPTMFPTERVSSSSQPPTVEPNSHPASTLPLQELYARDVQMSLEGVFLPLGVAAEKSFEQFVADSIAYAIVNIVGSESIDTLNVNISYHRPTTQRLLFAPIRTQFASSRSRLMLTENGDVLIFDTVVLLRSVLERHDLERYIGTAFNDDLEELVFVESLRTSGHVEFLNVSSVSVSPGSIGSQDEDRSEHTGKYSAERIGVFPITAVIVPILLVAAVVFSAAALLVWKKEKEERGRGGRRPCRAANNPPRTSSPTHIFDMTAIVANEIEINGGSRSLDNMSSLGDLTHSIIMETDWSIIQR